MAVKFANGQDVRQIVPAPIEGKVVKFIFDENTGAISYVVETIDADGVPHQRHFAESDIEKA